MAVTKIIPVRTTIENSISYICNPDKTESCLYVHSENCFPETAAVEFKFHEQKARAGATVIGRHLIQSFAPGEVSPELAHEIGKKLADEILGGQYAYVMTTHLDRNHIHNHFVWSTINLETSKRYISNKRSYHKIQEASDKLCAEYSLSVIAEPKGVGKSYTEYNAEKSGTRLVGSCASCSPKQPGWKAKLKNTIDDVLSVSGDFEEFLKRMEAQGYEIKRGTHISFRAPGQERFSRAKNLGDAYSEDNIKALLQKRKPQFGAPNVVKHAPGSSPAVKQIIDIENNKKIKSSAGYTHWAKIHNLKVSAATMNALEEFDSMEDFETKFKNIFRQMDSALAEIGSIKYRLAELSDLRPDIETYGKTRAVLEQYRAITDPKKKKQFYSDNKKAIDACRNAKKSFVGYDKLPTLGMIDKEIAELKASRAKHLKQYNDLKAEEQRLTPLRRNLYSILPQLQQREHAKNNENSL